MKPRFLLCTLLLGSSLFSQQIDYFQVQKVKANDTLTIRSLSEHTSEKVGAIPFDAQCVKNSGCGKAIRLEAMMQMEEEEIKTFLAQAKPEWCYVEYGGKKGWVNQFYLKKSRTPCE